MIHWGRHRFVMAPVGGWQSTKIGGGPTPIETSEGWLLIYHGVLSSCNGFVYSFGAVLLDLEKPWKVIHRTRPYLLTPREYYECVGDVPNVVFPCAALVDPPTGRMAIYYGGADTVTCKGAIHPQPAITYPSVRRPYADSKSAFLSTLCQASGTPLRLAPWRTTDTNGRHSAQGWGAHGPPPWANRRRISGPTSSTLPTAKSTPS